MTAKTSSVAPEKTARKLMSAAPWAVAESLMGAASTLATTILVARLLQPGDFGLATLAIAVAALAQVLTLAGVPEALVRTRHVHTLLTDSAFWALMGLGSLGTLLCWIVAYPLSLFYHQPSLFLLIGVQGFACMLAGLNGVPTALLTRKMRTKSLALRTLGLKILTLIVTVAAAASGLGAWSVVLGSLSGALAGGIILWAFQPRLPRPRFRYREIAPTLRLGWLIGVEQIVATLNIRAFVLLFGRFHGVHDLGLFNFALRLIDEVANLLSNTVNRLGLAFFASIQRTTGQGAAAFERGSHGITILSAPIFLGFAAVAPDLVPFIFGARWAEAVIVTQIIAVIWAVRFTRILSPALLRSLGAQSPLVINALLAIPVTMAMVLLTSRSSLPLAVASFAGQLVLTLPTGAWFLKRASGLSMWRQLKAVGLPFLAAGLMCLAVLAARTTLLAGLPVLPRLACSVGLGVVVFGLLLVIFDRRNIKDLVSMVAARRA